MAVGGLLDYPVRYQNLDLNSIDEAGEGLRVGCLLEEFDFGRAQGVGFTERRAQDDGLDASDVYLGARYVNLTGVVYGTDPGDLHDRLQNIRTILTPTVAYGFDKPNYGYLPLEFVIPTNDLDDWPDGTREVQVNARPMGQPQFTIRRDSGEAPGIGGANRGGGVMWRATLECKDPRVYIRPQTWITLAAATPAGGSNIKNRGDYPAPLDVQIVPGTATTAAHYIQIDIGTSNMQINFGAAGPPAEGFPLGTVFRYDGDLKILTVQTPGSTIDVLRMDLLIFRNNTTHPKVPPGTTKYAVRLYGGLLLNATSSRFMYSESYA